jgi:hypothetical protein
VAELQIGLKVVPLLRDAREGFRDVEDAEQQCRCRECDDGKYVLGGAPRSTRALHASSTIDA